MADVIVAFTTWPADKDPAETARALVEDGLAACVTIVPAVRSTYRWQGAVETAVEQQLVIKTTRARVDALWAALQARHPYDVPEFVVLPVVQGNPAYLDWIEQATR